MTFMFLNMIAMVLGGGAMETISWPLGFATADICSPGTRFFWRWDMLVLSPLEELLPNLKPGEMLIAGFRPLTEVQEWWSWVNGDYEGGKEDLHAFRQLLAEEYNYHGELYCGLLVPACFPRRFLELYCETGPPPVGFVEYKLPTFAKVFDIPICHEHPFKVWWSTNPTTRQAPWHDRVLNAVNDEVPVKVILEELRDPEGHRTFHPFYRKFPSRWLNLKVFSGTLKAYRRYRSMQRFTRRGQRVFADAVQRMILRKTTRHS